MALTPQNNEAFFKEVDEELRRTRLESFWRRNGIAMVVGLVLGLVLFAGYLAWQRHRTSERETASLTMTGALDDLSKRRSDAAAPKLAELAGRDDGYGALARITQASAALARNDPKAASAGFAAVANDPHVAEPFRQVALIRQTQIDFDTLPPAEIITRLAPLSVVGNAWYPGAAELTALAQLKLGRKAEAGRLLAAIVADKDAPASIRSRTFRLASQLGVDVKAPGGAIFGN